jgi:PAS domain-containing protein
MQEQWNALVEQFSRITDGLGKPIDSEIFETVVALNALGIPTVMSCGGHIDDGRGLLLPWVDVESSDPHLTEVKAEEARLIEAAKLMQQEVKRLHQEHVDIIQIKAAKRQANETYEKMHTIQWQLRVLQAEPRKQLAVYLAQFYAERHVPFDRRLVLEGKGRTRLHNQGAADLYLLAPEDIQRQKLTEYREEMAAFTAFLKQIYFSNRFAHA